MKDIDGDFMRKYDEMHKSMEYKQISDYYEARRHIVVLLPCGCLSLNPFIEISIRNNSSSSDVLNIQASISISPKFESK